MQTQERLKEKEQPEVLEKEARKAPPRRRYVGWMLVAGAAAVIAVAATVALILSGDGGEEVAEVAPTPAVEQPVTEPAAGLRSELHILADLANQGYIPAAAVPWEEYYTEQLVNKGLIPAATLRHDFAPVEPLFTAEELATIELAETGRIPMESVDWEEVELKRMVNRGLIPRQALD